jgi:hypothetical protein
MAVLAVRARTKTVTRRHVNTWQTLKPGDHLTLIEKGMGLAKGEKQVVLAEVKVVGVRVEPITLLTSDIRYGRQEVELEGFPGADPDGWVKWWASSHHVLIAWDAPVPMCRRIEWRYLDESVSRDRPPRSQFSEAPAPLSPRLDDVTPRGGARGGGRS